MSQHCGKDSGLCLTKVRDTFLVLQITREDRNWSHSCRPLGLRQSGASRPSNLWEGNWHRNSQSRRHSLEYGPTLYQLSPYISRDFINIPGDSGFLANYV